MGQLEDILKHQNMVRNNIMKSFGAETSEDSLEKSFEDEVNPFEKEAYKSELTKAELDEFEKAKHQDGDMHPNGKWVWRQSANGGKGDWRVAKPSRGGGSKATSVGGAAATDKNSSTNASSSALSDKEKNAFVDIMKKNSSHKDAHMNLEQMSDDELRKFANAASLLSGDKTNLNDKTRANIKGWMKLAHDEQTARRKNKKTESSTKKTDSKQIDEVSVKDVKAIETFPDLDEDKHLKRGNKVLKEYTLSVNINGKKIEGTTHEFWASNNLSNTSVGGFETTVYIGSGFPLDKHVKTLEEAKSLFLSTVKKKLESKTYASDAADAYDKGDGKVGNYPVPTHTSYPAANLYNRMKSNRHMSFKYGLPSDEIMKKLKDYKGNVKVSYHINAGTIEIYRIKFL